MKASHPMESLWQVQRKEQQLAEALGIGAELNARDFLSKLLEVGVKVGAIRALAGGADGAAVLAASDLLRLSKVLKGLWRFGMTRDLLRSAADMGLIKFLKTLKKKHPDATVKASAQKIVGKWMALEVQGISAESSTSSSLAAAAAVVAITPKATKIPTPIPAALAATGAGATCGREFSSNNPPTSTALKTPIATSTAPPPASIIDEKLREKVRTALAKEDAALGVKPTCETSTLVAAVEKELFAASKGNKKTFKEVTRKLLDICGKDAEKKAALNAGAMTVTELLAAV